MRRILIERPAPKDAVDSWDYKPTITNFVTTGDYVYATIDNASPTTLAQGCTNHAYLMPEVCACACLALALVVGTPHPFSNASQMNTGVGAGGS